MKILSFLIVISVFLFSSDTFPANDYISGLCMSLYFDVQGLKIKWEEKLRNLEQDIAVNERRIREVNNLLAEIQKKKAYGTEKEKKDALNAEPRAQEALILLKNTRNHLEKEILEARMILNRLKQEEDSTINLCKNLRSPKATGVVRNCTGEVRILNKREQKETICSLYSVVHEGDEIITGPDGRAQVNLLQGKGKVELEPGSRLFFLKDTAEEQRLEMNSGKAKFDIDSEESFKQKLKEWSGKYEKAIKTSEEWIERQSQKLNVWMCQKLKSVKDCIDPHIILGVRGTSFLIDRIGEYEAMITVLEGVVDITLPEFKKSFTVETGNGTIIYSDGRVILK